MSQYVEVNGHSIEFPDGMSRTDIEAAIKANYMRIPKPAAVQAGSVLNDIPRQIGLTARYGMEGLANTAQAFTEPVRQLITDPMARAVQGDLTTNDLVLGKMKARGKPLGQIATEFADWMGLPSPRNANERVVGDATRLVAGAGGVVKGAQAASNVVTGTAQKVLTALAANPTTQLSAAAGGGLAGGASREAGGTDLEQIGATVLGTLAGGMTPGTVNALVSRVQAMRGSPLQLEGRIALALRESGVDWATLPQNIRTSLVADVRRATATGDELNPDAVRRLADFRLTGTTPTRGTLTLDPVQITREQNLAKLGANSADEGLQGLARVQNENNTRLIGNLNTMGAGRGDPMRAGTSTVERVMGRDATMQQNVSQLYRAARDMPGGDIPLRRDQIVGNIYDRLARENKLAFLPKEVSDMIDTISAGTITRNGQQFDVPFDARTLDNLLTTIATAQRGTRDGNVRAALSIVRNAIDDTPITPVKAEFGGNQVVTEAGARFLRESDEQAPQFMEALNRARAAARERFAWQESSRPVAAILDGVEPDKIVQRFVVGGSVADARALAQNGDAPALRDALLNHLKSKAVNGASDEVAKFSQAAFNKAMRDIGEDKLRIFFSPEEITQLQANARVASYMQAQPVGSAVNNSNSGALMLGQGYDWLNSIASVLPFGRQIVVDPLRSIDIGLSQRAAQGLVPALRVPTPRQVAPGLLGPGVAMGGLLAAPGPVGP
ncbi:hypothetical protein [uncultured Hydrogenophaga sp.]|uniref:hypothetical protein n=1 Tax=uncultured Hydrogenophaga sp. TaxID=199683 RepID=UPI002584EF64|nr:hypothetical protein [uncultured Hydrogenophaga sp.]